MAQLTYIKSPSDFDKSVVPANKVLSFVGLTDDGLPTPYYKLSDGTVYQLYELIMSVIRQNMASGFEYITVSDIVDNKITVPGVPVSIVLPNGTYKLLDDAAVTVNENSLDWTVDITALLAQVNIDTFYGNATVFYHKTDYVYTTTTAPALSFTISGVAEDADVNGTYVPVEE